VIRGLLVTLAMAILVFCVVMLMSILALYMGRTRASMRVEYELGRIIEWLTGEGRYRKVEQGDTQRA
jgi:hypothetical protein